MNGRSHDYYGADLEAMANAKNYNQWILEEFAHYLRGHVVEVGAGIGNFSEYLLQTPLEILDVFEPSQNMYPMLAEKFSLENKVSTHNCYFPGMNGDLDAIVYCNVLEHIEDDLGEMIKARNSLRPDGHLLIFVPALPFLYSKMDYTLGHHRRYQKEELVTRLQQAGFEVVKVKYFDFLGIIPWYVFFVLLKRSFSKTNVSLYDKVGIPLTKMIESLFSPPFGKNLVAVAKPS